MLKKSRRRAWWPWPLRDYERPPDNQEHLSGILDLLSA